MTRRRVDILLLRDVVLARLRISTRYTKYHRSQGAVSGCQIMALSHRTWPSPSAGVDVDAQPVLATAKF